MRTSEGPATVVTSRLPGGASHRRDIQGLRGVAVLLVVGYHSGIGPRGGFLGVDVFLVISGFVVGRMLLDERIRTGTLRVRNFFARRVRRLLPALAVCTVVTAVLSALLLSPFGDQQRVLWTGMAATVFLANVELYRTTGYFDSSAEHNPFLHTWSLSLEEQFYVLLPLALAFAWWLANRRRRPVAGSPARSTRVAALVVMGLMAVVSLGLSIVLTSGAVNPGLQAPTRLVFYSMPTRVWEFAAGVVLALAGPWMARVAPRALAVVGITGLAALAAATLGLEPLAPQMGIWTVLAVGGAAALIAAGTSGVPSTTVLSVAPLVWLGDRSYGWYLWHWPVIVFAGVLWPGRPYVLVVAAVFSLVPTELSHRFVERPFRVGATGAKRGGAQSRGAGAVGLALVCILVPLVVLGGLRFGADRHWGLSEPPEWYDLPPTHDTNCHIINRDAANSFDADTCSFGPPAAEATGTVLLLGDELADSVGPGVIGAASAQGRRTVQWSRAGCPAVQGSPGAHYPACAQWQTEAFGLIERLQPDAVVLANQHLDRAQREALAGTLDALAGAAVPVVLVAPIPDFGDAFPRLRLSVVNPQPAVPTLGPSQVERQRGAVVGALSRNARGRPGVSVVDPLDRLCDRGCRPVRDGRWQYLGPRALTADAARRLTDDISDALGGRPR